MQEDKGKKVKVKRSKIWTKLRNWTETKIQMKKELNNDNGVDNNGIWVESGVKIKLSKEKE